MLLLLEASLAGAACGSSGVFGRIGGGTLAVTEAAAELAAGVGCCSAESCRAAARLLGVWGGDGLLDTASPT